MSKKQRDRLHAEVQQQLEQQQRDRDRDQDWERERAAQGTPSFTIGLPGCQGLPLPPGTPGCPGVTAEGERREMATQNGDEDGPGVRPHPEAGSILESPALEIGERWWHRAASVTQGCRGVGEPHLCHLRVLRGFRTRIHHPWVLSSNGVWLRHPWVPHPGGTRLHSQPAVGPGTLGTTSSALLCPHVPMMSPRAAHTERAGIAP